MSIFTEAYKLGIKEDFKSKDSISYEVKGKNTYFPRIYKKGCSWFLQCGCQVGVLNKPHGLCKHSIITIVKQFLKENKLKLVKNEEN